MLHALPIACLLISFGLPAQRLGFVHYTADNSALPHDIVYNVSQGKNGCLWISTDDGLACYDGTKMTICNDHLRSRYVIDAREADGKIWIATWNGGIHLRDAGINRPLIEKSNTGFQLATNRLIIRDNTVIAYNFTSYMAFRYDARYRSLTAFSLKNKPGGDLCIKPSQKEYYRFFNTLHSLLACGQNGIYKVKHGTLHLLRSGIVPDEIRENTAGKLFVRIGDTIWHSDETFTHLRHFYTVNRSRNAQHDALRPHVLTRFEVLPSGKICLGFSDSPYSAPIDFHLVNPQTGVTQDLSREVGARAQTTGLLVDREGSLWLSTDGDGLYHIFDRQFNVLPSSVFFSYAAVTDLFQASPDSLFIGSKRGVYLYCNGEIRQFGAPWHPYVLKLFKAPNGHIGITADQNGSALLLKKSRKPVYYTDWKRFAKWSVEYIGNMKLHVFPTKGKHRTLAFPERISDVAEDNRGRLWIATLFSLYVHISGTKIKRIPLPAHARINSLLSEDGYLWIGTSKGLLVLRNGKIRYKKYPESLADKNVRCLFSDKKGSLWIGTEQGLFHLVGRQLTVFRKRDGLIADDMTSITALNDRELAVGSSQGITLLPLSYRKEKSEATIDIEQVRVNGQNSLTGRVLEIPYSGRLSISYRSPTFIYPELVQFRYRLNALDRWHLTGDRSLLFNHLQPGDYTLEIGARKYDSSFSRSAVLRFKILQPWWATAPFIVAAAAFIFTLVFLFFRWQLRKQKLSLNARRELSELQIKALQAQLNPHFVSNALSTIQYYGLVNDELAFNRYFSQFSELTRLFLEVSRRGLIPLKTELELVRNYLELEQLRFNKQFVFTIEIDPEIDCEKVHLPGLIIQPLAENAIHHGLVYLPQEVSGILTIRVERHGRILCVTVDDNGIGRTQAAVIRKNSTHVFESRSGAILKEMQEAWNQYYGYTLSISTCDKFATSGESAGTCVTISIDLASAHQTGQRKKRGRSLIPASP